MKTIALVKDKTEYYPVFQKVFEAILLKDLQKVNQLVILIGVTNWLLF